jgi:hypothetical protein
LGFEPLASSGSEVIETCLSTYRAGSKRLSATCVSIDQSDKIDRETIVKQEVGREMRKLGAAGCLIELMVVS